MTKAHTTEPTLSDLDVITGLVSKNMPCYRDAKAVSIVKSDMANRLCAFNHQLSGYLMASQKPEKSAAAMQPAQILLKSDKMT